MNEFHRQLCLVDLVVDVLQDQYVIGNYEVFGYYRVNYDAENWNRIMTQLDSDFMVSSKALWVYRNFQNHEKRNFPSNYKNSSCCLQ